MNEKSAGIYCIWNTITNKYYVGSSFNIEKRFKQHKYQLRKNEHCNYHLQYAWNKYEENDFQFLIMADELNIEDLIICEQFWMNQLNSIKDGYNLCPVAGSALGIKRSDETRKRISKSNKGRKISLETREQLRKVNLGKKASIGCKIKMSKKKQGEGNNKAILTNEQVREIKFKYIPEGILTQPQIGEIYGVSASAISDIKLNKNWKHITE